MIASGLLLADRYRLTGRIAVGGMGEVWQADDTRLHRTVAVKILKAELSGDAEFLHRFRAEARTTASLNHPGIAAVHDYGEASADGSSDEDTSGHVAYLVMELVKGEPLAGILAKDGRLSAERLLPILHQAGKALNAAHEHGLVHRDVKPGNILVTREADGTETVKLTDFGIAKAGHSAPVTRGGMVMGTAHYIAPEQATGQNATPASDVYSLTVCGYECLAGHRPFIADHAVTVAMMHIRDIPPPLPPDVPPTVRALIEGTLVKDPNQRYATGGEYADAVAMVMAGHMPPAPIGATRTPPGGLAMPATAAAPHPATLQVATPSAPFAPAVPASRGTGWIWGLVAVIAVVLVVLAVVLLLVMRDGGPDGDQPGSPVVTTPQTTLPGSPPFGTPSEPPAETTTESVPTDEETAPPESTYESGETEPSPFSPEQSPTQDGVEGLDGDGIDGASHNHVDNGDHNARETLIAAGQRQPPRRGVW